MLRVWFSYPDSRVILDNKIFNIFSNKYLLNSNYWTGMTNAEDTAVIITASSSLANLLLGRKSSSLMSAVQCRGYFRVYVWETHPSLI